MHKRHRSFIGILLVVVLVLDEGAVAEVAHVGAGVPPNAIRVNIDFPKALNHLCLIRCVGFRSRRRCSIVNMRTIVLRILREIDDREWEAVGDFERAVNIHANEITRRCRRKLLRAVFDDFQHHLQARQSRSHLRRY